MKDNISNKFKDRMIFAISIQIIIINQIEVLVISQTAYI